MPETDELATAVFFSRNTDRIHVELDATVLDIRDAVFLRHQLDRAIADYEGHVGR